MRRVPRSLPRPAADRRGMSFVYALITLTVMLTLGAVFLHLGLNSAKWAYAHCEQQRAFYLAEAATDYAIWMMQQSASGVGGINDALALSDADALAGVTRTYQSAVFPLAGGSYQFTCIAPHKCIPGTVEIHASGAARGAGTQRVLKVLRPTYAPAAQAYTAAPCFGYGLFSDHNFTMGGSPVVKGHSENGGNAIYANGNAVFTGTPTVYGPVHATGSIIVTGTLNQIPANAGRVSHFPRVAMPELDLSTYQAMADETLGSGGTVSLTGNIDAPLGTPADPKIIYVNGKLKLTGTVNLTGCGIMVASKGIEIAGNVRYGSSENTSWGFLTAGTFKLTGNAQVYGSIYCHNASGTADFTAAGTANVYGAVVADVVTLNGNYMVEWDGAPGAMGAMPGAVASHGAPQVETLLWQRGR